MEQKGILSAGQRLLLKSDAVNPEGEVIEKKDEETAPDQEEGTPEGEPASEGTAETTEEGAPS